MILYGLILSLVAGLAISLGAWLASLNVGRSFWSRDEIRHFIIAIGGGALISAITFILIPDGAERQGNLSTLATFFLGGVSFMLFDIWLASLTGRFGQFFAMMLDFVPEAIVLGAVITESLEQAIFLALVMVAQNIPEGYAAFTDLVKKGNRKRLLMIFFLIGLTGPLYVLLGVQVFINHPTVLGMIMTFCAGGILYLVFEDIAPQSVMKKHWLPPLGAVFGFMIGLFGYLYLKH